VLHSLHHYTALWILRTQSTQLPTSCMLLVCRV